MVDGLRRVFASQTAASRLADEIHGFRTLRPGWNSYRAPEISETAIKTAVQIVERVARRRGTLPSAAPTPLGGVALIWEIRDFKGQLLIDDDRFEYSVARRAHPKVLDHGSLTETFNPGSVRSSDEANAARQLELASEVTDRGFVSYPGEGVGDDGGWPPEPSLLILGINRDDAERLGRRLG